MRVVQGTTVNGSVSRWSACEAFRGHLYIEATVLLHSPSRSCMSLCMHTSHTPRRQPPRVDSQPVGNTACTDPGNTTQWDGEQAVNSGAAEHQHQWMEIAADSVGKLQQQTAGHWKKTGKPEIMCGCSLHCTRGVYPNCPLSGSIHTREGKKFKFDSFTAASHFATLYPRGRASKEGPSVKYHYRTTQRHHICGTNIQQDTTKYNL